METIAHYLAEDIKVNQDFKYRQIVGLRTFRSIVIGDFPARKSAREFPYEYVYRGDISDWGAFIKKHNIVAIHCHQGDQAKRILPVARRHKIPLIVSFRGNDASSKRKRNRAFYRKLAKHGSLFLPVCRFFRRELIKMGFPKKKIKVLYGGIDLRRFRYREFVPARDGKHRILTVGRLAKKKGFPVLLKAFRSVHRKLPKAKLIIIAQGNAKRRRSLRRKIRKYGLQKCVVLKGPVPNRRIALEMRRAHLFCLPSRRTREGAVEGIPNVLKEAMATGVPVVSTFHAGIPELVMHKRNGVLVKEKDAKALARAIVRLLKDPKRCAKYAARARRTVEEKFNLDRQLRLQEHYYERLLHR